MVWKKNPLLAAIGLLAVYIRDEQRGHEDVSLLVEVVEAIAACKAPLLAVFILDSQYGFETADGKAPEPVRLWLLELRRAAGTRGMRPSCMRRSRSWRPSLRTRLRFSMIRSGFAVRI